MSDYTQCVSLPLACSEFSSDKTTRKLPLLWDLHVDYMIPVPM
jgi:hypothetical protein